MTDKQSSLQFIYHLPDGLNEDLQAMNSNVTRFKAGEMTAGDFRAFRVPQGIYQQRRCGTFMLRVRLAAAAILPHQMRAVANISRQYGSGRSHATTRGDLQIHDVEVDGMYPALCALRQVGLSTKGGGGDTVRNIPACYDAGVCVREAFDVTPYAVAVTECLLSDRTSFELPRKYKLAFSGCGKDCASATVSDAGFIAKRRNRSDGFAVYVGGGLGARSRVADILEDFVPADQAHLVAEAIKRVFARHGERKNRRKARLRFLIERIGIDHFGNLYEQELAALKNQSVQCPALRQIVPTRAAEPKRPDTSGPSEAFDLWRGKRVVPQRQNGY